ncbi:MAG: hypothetical protein MJ071_06060 [Oscillospiraceae bacterium]|nr:hypothetical protein [Oscillospiraceae bacterium]
MKSYIDQELACALYRLAEQRMQAADRSMPCSEEVYLLLTTATPGIVSYRDMQHLSNPDFLEASYLLLLNRPLDEPARQVWEQNYDLPKEAFHAAVLKTIIQSGEYQHIRTSVTECPLQLCDEEQKNMLVASQALPERLVRLYQSMPRPLQKLAKKIAGKE